MTAAPTLVDATKQAIKEHLQGDVTFPATNVVRIHYSFESSEQFDDWMEYPEDAGRGLWIIEKGALSGNGRRGVRHRVRFRDTLSLVIKYRESATGRIHFLDTGRGSAEFQTDFRSLNRLNGKSELLPVEFIRNGESRIEMGLDDNQFFLKRGTVRVERPAGRDSSGFVGLWAWGTTVEIESITISGTPDADWLKTFQLQAELLKKIGESSAAGKSAVALLPKDTPVSWPFKGPEPRRGRGGEFVLLSGDSPCQVTFSGLRWTNYTLEGWFNAPERGSLSLRGRAQLNRLPDGACVVKLSPQMLQVSRSNSIVTQSEVHLQPNRQHPFRVTWYGNAVTVEINGTQRLHSRVKMRSEGGIVLLLAGQGTKAGGLRLKLLAERTKP